MQRALQIPELVGAICSHVYSKKDDVDGSKTENGQLSDLAALATTSRIFCDPALNALWNEQDSLAPILRCFPADLWDQDLDSVDTLNSDIIRPITPVDWSRPLFYLHRVRTFEAFDEESVPFAGVLTALSLCLPAKHFFPNLTKFSWQCQMDDPLFYFVRLFLAPTITDLGLNVPDFVPHLSLIPTIARRCPRLKHVDVRCGDYPRFREHIRTAVSLFVQDLHCVESLLIHDLDRAAFEHIASLPSLTSLTVEALELFPELSTSSPFSDAPLFPNLATLDIVTETIRNCNSLLKASSASPLATIDIVVATQRPASIDDILDFYNTLGAHSPSEPMRVLKLVALVAEPDVTPALYGRKHAALRQLFSFCNLVALYLEIPDGFSPDDALLDEMAHAWPHLMTLVIEPNTPRSIPRRATLAALRSFAKHCPDLNTLRIELTAMHVPLPLDPQAAVGKRNVHTLGVGYAPITDADAVADFIFGIFPDIVDLVPESDISEEGYSDHWLAVQGGLDLRRRGGEVTN